MGTISIGIDFEVRIIKSYENLNGYFAFYDRFYYEVIYLY